MLRRVLNDEALRTAADALRDVDDQAIESLLMQVTRPLLAKIQELLPTRQGLLRACQYVVPSLIVWWQSHKYYGHLMNERRWRKKCYYNLVSAQLYATHGDTKKDVKFVDKRTLFQKDMKDIGILRDKHMQRKVVAAAERTTPEDPFVTSFLKEHDTWYVLNTMLNELSTIAVMGHLGAMQAATDRDSSFSQHNDWYVIALTAPKEGTSMHHDDGLGRVRGDVRLTKLCLTVVWEHELFSIVMGKIKMSETGLGNHRQVSRWKLLQQIAHRYKFYICRHVFRKARMREKEIERHAECVRTASVDAMDGTFTNDFEVFARQISSTEKRTASKSSLTLPTTRIPSYSYFLGRALPGTYLANCKWKKQKKGNVTMEEFIQAAADMYIPDKVARRIFDELDANHDHELSIEEVTDTRPANGLGFKRSRMYVDSHLLKVHLPGLKSPSPWDFCCSP